MRKYTTIVFDLGNVLLPFDHKLWVTNFNKIENDLGTKLYDLYKNNFHIQMEYEGGKISDEEFIKINLEWLEHKVSKEEFCKIFSNIFTVNEKVVNLLPVLKKEYKLVLLSNTSNIHKEYGWKNYSFINHFDKQILSHEVGIIKPDEEIYRLVEDYSGEPSDSHIFIDDILVNVNAAKNIGWDGIHFKGYEDLILEFKTREII